MVDTGDIRHVFELNTIAFLDLLQGLMRSFDNPSSVVAISSIAAHLPHVGNSVYGASKIALERIAASFSVELRDKGIRVNCVSPALVDTEMLHLMAESARQESLVAVNSERPLTAHEVANVILFLLSPDSSAINGEVIELGCNLPSISKAV